MSARITRIDPAKSREVLDYLQAECLPLDDPCDYRDVDHWFIARDNGLPVGFAMIRPTTHNPRIWYMARAGVLVPARGKGLQKRLIAARIKAARASGNCEYIVTDCTADNPASANSLIRAGFRVMEPSTCWALPNSIYWRFNVCSDSDSPAT